MKIIIHRHGSEYGPYTLEETKQHLASGALLEDDLAWTEGGTEWVPLKNLLSQLPPPPSDQAPAPLLPQQKEPSAATKIQPKAGSSLNRYVVGCVFSAGVVALVILLCLFFLPVVLERLVTSFFTNTPVLITGSSGADYSMVTMTVDGAVMSVNIKTNYTDTKLRDEVMAQIYLMTVENPGVTKLTVTIHETVGATPLQVVLHPGDLDNIRKFSDKQAYAQSPDRNLVDSELKAAGL